MRCKSFKVVAIVIAVLVALILIAAAAFTAVVLISAGLLSVFAALGSIIGLLGAVASDLSPPAMLFTGFFFVFAALSICTALYILCPKGVRYLSSVTDNIFG
ncbi:MAG: hypothetical protein FWH08_01940 [Oscillospiraceae bacterium]|nr:hypothetical protein [Oscillospiraceae bacterium]